MPKEHCGFETVRHMGIGLPDVEDGTAYGSPALKLRGKLLACMATNRSDEIERAARDCVAIQD